MTRNVLVTGFGAFLDVADNSSERLARAVDGLELPGVRVHGRVLPVRYVDGPAAAIAAAEELDAHVVLGLGVDRRTATVDVETRAFNLARGADTDGHAPGVLEPGGPAILYANAEVIRLARALDARLDDDAGRYVCNAWLYTVTRALAPRRQVVFVHVPRDGMAVERLIEAISAVFR